jgi:hypothetical protein
MEEQPYTIFPLIDTGIYQRVSLRNRPTPSFAANDPTLSLSSCYHRVPQHAVSVRAAIVAGKDVLL